MVRKFPLPGTYLTNPLLKGVRFGHACRSCRESCSSAPWRGCSGDNPGDGIVESSPLPTVERFSPTLYRCCRPYTTVTVEPDYIQRTVVELCSNSRYFRRIFPGRLTTPGMESSNPPPSQLLNDSPRHCTGAVDPTRLSLWNPTISNVQ